MATIEITSYSANGGFCGLVLKDSGNNVLADYNGCGEDAVDAVDTLTISTGYRLAGFMLFGSTNFKLVPVQYREYYSLYLLLLKQNYIPEPQTLPLCFGKYHDFVQKCFER